MYILMADKNSQGVLVPCTSAAKLLQSRAGTLYNKIKKHSRMQAFSVFPNSVVQCTLKTAYTKHLKYVKRKIETKRGAVEETARVRETRATSRRQ